MRAKLKSLIPPALRNPKFLALAYGLASPMEDVLDTYNEVAGIARRMVRYNGQTMVLEQALNDTFPDGNGTIRIITPGGTMVRTVIWQLQENQKNPFLYSTSEGNPPRYLYNRAEWRRTNHFIIQIPLGSGIDHNALSSFVNIYRQAASSFSIEEV